MYLCFETEDKRSAFPEAQMISVDENGFSLTSPLVGKGLIFFRMDSFRGASPTFQQALSWVKRQDQKKPAEPGKPAPPVAAPGPDPDFVRY